MSTSHEMVFPLHWLKRSIRKSQVCIPTPYVLHATGPWVSPGPRDDSSGWCRSLNLGTRREGYRVGRADVDRVGPREDALRPRPLRLKDRDEVRVVLRLVRDDRIPGLQRG